MSGSSPTPVPSPFSKAENGEGGYASGAASLFHAMAAQVPDISFRVTCPYCFSEDTEEVSRQHGIFYCNHCESRFERPASDPPATGVDRDGQSRPPAV